MSQSPRPLRTEESHRETRRPEDAARIYATKSGGRKLVDKGRVIVTSGDRLITTMGNAGSSNFHIRQNANMDRIQMAYSTSGKNISRHKSSMSANEHCQSPSALPQLNPIQVNEGT